MKNSVHALRTAENRARASEHPTRAASAASVDYAMAAGKSGTALFSVEWWAAFFGIAAITSGSGDLAIGVYLLCCTTVFARHIQASSLTLLHFVPLLAYPALGLFSTLWSDAPGITEKQGAEVLLFFGTAIILCRPLRLIEMAAAIELATLICALLCLAVQPSAFHGVPLHGILGSKNQVAFIAQILLISSLAVAFNSNMPRIFRLFSVCAGAVAGLDLHLAQSAGGTVTTVAAVTVLIGLALVTRLKLTTRMALVLGVVVTISPLLFVAKDVIEQAQAFQLNVLHKDATLTGRTDLWAFAKSLIAEKPLLGHGFDAFWRQGNMDAEGLWERFGIGGRAGFNFHNQFVEAQVDLGHLGLAVLIATLLCVGVASIWRAVRQPSLGNALATALLVSLYTKLPVESVLIGPWSLYSLVFMMSAVAAFGGEVGLSSQPKSLRPPAWRRTGPARLDVAPSLAKSPAWRPM